MVDRSRRGRLILESRAGSNPYTLEYRYDPGGNRTEKIDYVNEIRVEYHYDLEAPTYYESANNRLMYYLTYDTSGPGKTLVSTTYYQYQQTTPFKSSGNVERIITVLADQGGSSSAMSSGGEFLTTESSGEPLSTEDSGGAAAAAAPGGCGIHGTMYSAIRLGYGNNNRTVTFVHHECPSFPAAPELCDDAPALVASSVLGPSGVVRTTVRWADARVTRSRYALCRLAARRRSSASMNS